jgi:hypothetical protein
MTDKKNIAAGLFKRYRHKGEGHTYRGVGLPIPMAKTKKLPTYTFSIF